MKRVRLRQAQIGAFIVRAGGHLLTSRLFAIWLGLATLGFWIGTQARPEPGTVPFEELFESLRVLSYREAPSDTAVRFVVELSARGRPFRQYDVDSRRFEVPARGHDYWRSISGTRYPPLKVRGHVNRGFWLELPDASTDALLPEQFEELYSTTFDFVKPVTMATTVLGLLSGYSVGYRLATWGSSLSNPKVQERVLSLPGIGPLIAREAWRRVALEPAVVFAENDAGRFASVSGRQRLYTNFFKLAVDDSNGFIPYEISRLESGGSTREACAMSAFVRAVTCATQDSCELSSADFSAIEEWASLIDRRGHWGVGATPPIGEERLRYFGTLAWYGLAPEASDQRRIWVGPRLLVRNGEAEGFVADEIPLVDAACPVAWRGWLVGDDMNLSANAWTAQWMGDARQFAPVVKLCMRIGQAVSGRRDPVRIADHPDVRPGMAGPAPPSAGAPSAHTAPAREDRPLGLQQPSQPDSQYSGTVRIEMLGAPPSYSMSALEPHEADSLLSDPDQPALNAGMSRSILGDLER